MINNNYAKKLFRAVSVSSSSTGEKKSHSVSFWGVVVTLLLVVTGTYAQTDRIPVNDGNFSNGSTFAANGWTAANEGTNPAKWVVGSAVSAADVYPYVETGQVVGLLAGMKGASEYEILVHEGKYSEGKRTAVQGMDAQSLGHLIIMVFIIIGNIGYFATRRKK